MEVASNYPMLNPPPGFVWTNYEGRFCGSATFSIRMRPLAGPKYAAFFRSLGLALEQNSNFERSLYAIMMSPRW